MLRRQRLGGPRSVFPGRSLRRPSQYLGDMEVIESGEVWSLVPNPFTWGVYRVFMEERTVVVLLMWPSQIVTRVRWDAIHVFGEQWDTQPIIGRLARSLGNPRVAY